MLVRPRRPPGLPVNTLQRLQQRSSQLNAQQVQLNFQQSGLTSLSTVASNLQGTLTNALANGSGDGIMTELQSYFSQAAEALNSQYSGQYLFGGGQTQTQPFTATSLADLTTQPSVSSFFQNGGTTPVTRIDDSTTIQSGFLASDLGTSLMTAFQGIEAFQQSSSGSFSGPLTTAQQNFLTSAITQLDNVVTSTTQTTAQGGDMQAQVASAITTQTDRQTTLTTSLGDMTDVNMAQAAANLTQAQTAVQASAQVFSTLKSMSLLDYLAAPTS